MKTDLPLYSPYFRFTSVLTPQILILSNFRLLRWPMIGTFTLQLSIFVQAYQYIAE